MLVNITMITNDILLAMILKRFVIPVLDIVKEHIKRANIANIF